MDIHPIVAQMSPSKEQMPAVLARGCDVVVTAGAGTGKTRTLVARYLSLVAEGRDLRSILAITFTRKAAREMRNRVRDEIRRYLEHPDLGEAERQEWQDRYTALDAARIGTIHSFCGEILRAHPAEAAVDPRFQTLEEGQANILLSRAVDEALAWAADEPDVVRLFALLGEFGLRNTLTSLVGQRLDAGQAFDRLPEDLLAHWQQALLEWQERCLEALLQRPEWSDAVETLREDEPILPDDRMAVERQAVLAALASLERPTGPLPGRLDALSRLNDVYLRGGSSNAWPGGREQMDDVKGALGTLRGLWRGQASVLELSINAQDRALAGAMPLLHAVYRRAVATYRALKEERQALDFDDLEREALSLLEAHADVRARWQREFRAILVDEFQDTNSRQRDLVALINDGGKLFIVGDAKQSIYRFRGADVTVFRQEREQVKGRHGLDLPLETSYRGHKGLIETLNGLLRPVLGEKRDPNRPWAEPFAPLVPYRGEAGPGFTAPHVELHLTVGSKSRGALYRAADALVQRINELLEGQVQVADGDAFRLLEYGDIAILCRTSTWFRAYEDALEKAGVPFLTVAGRGFHQRPEIRDVLNTLQALADPTNDLALAGLLRSPAFALSDAALYHLCQERDQDGGFGSLWEVLRAAPSVLVGEDGRRAQRAARTITELSGQVGRTAVADILKGFLDATGYRAALMQTGQARAARNVSKLLADAHASGIVGVGEFLEYLTGLRDAGAREGEARSTAEGAVQIMTIHAAKGLEFPVVAIGDVTSGGGRGSSLVVDDGLGPLIKLADEDGEIPAVYHLGKAQADDQEAAESDRLLYVAATRAREKLILSGCIGLRKDGTLSKPGGYLGRLAGPQCLGLLGVEIPYNDEGEEARKVPLGAGSASVACTIYEPGHAWDRMTVAPEAPALGPSPVPPPLLAPVPSVAGQVDERTADQERVPRQRVWRVVPAVERPRAPAWVIGSLVHEALAAWRLPTEVDAEFARWCEARARGYGVTDGGQRADAVQRTRLLLHRFRSHALFAEMDGAGRRLHEVPYSIVVDGRVERGIIDAVYQRQGVWTLVEFKTDHVRDQADFARLLAEEDYVAQAQRYAAAAETLIGQQPKVVLCMLNYAGSVHVHQVAAG
jgi:ATP-dependent helicase/nuclease subunit A